MEKYIIVDGHLYKTDTSLIKDTIEECLNGVVYFNIDNPHNVTIVSVEKFNEIKNTLIKKGKKRKIVAAGIVGFSYNSIGGIKCLNVGGSYNFEEGRWK